MLSQSNIMQQSIPGEEFIAIVRFAVAAKQAADELKQTSQSAEYKALLRELLGIHDAKKSYESLIRIKQSVLDTDKKELETKILLDQAEINNRLAQLKRDCPDENSPLYQHSYELIMKDQNLLEAEKQVLAALNEEGNIFRVIKEIKETVAFYKKQENAVFDKILSFKVSELELKKGNASAAYLERTKKTLQHYGSDQYGQQLSDEAAQYFAQCIYNDSEPNSPIANFKTKFVERFNSYFKTNFSVKIVEELEDKERLSQNKKDLIQKLDVYIDRIESHKKTIGGREEIDFSWGFRFPFFRESRALNREANYTLAQQLKEQLSEDKNNKDIKDLSIVAHPGEMRKEFFQNKQNRFFFADHGIHSQELKTILKAAKRM